MCGSSTSAKGSVETNTNEEAWHYGGAGFSVFFDAKSFQSDAVSTYFATASTLQNPGRYNADGAAYPDLAAQSEAFVICYESCYYAVSGTSCSCPTVAGFLAMAHQWYATCYGNYGSGYYDDLVSELSNVNGISSLMLVQFK